MIRRLAKVLLLLVPVVGLAGCGHSGGDPSNGVLQLLMKTTAVVPPGESGVSIRSMRAEWVQPCPEFSEAQAGWSSDEVFLQFTGASPTVNVLDHVDSVLKHLGWHRHDIVITHGRGPVPHWTLTTHRGSKANAFAFEAPAGSDDWFVNLSWQPPGPKAESCP